MILLGIIFREVFSWESFYYPPQPFYPILRNLDEPNSIKDMKLFSLLIAICCALIFPSCHRPDENAEMAPVTNPCLSQTFQKRLYKVMHTAFDETTGKINLVYQDQYFFDANNRLDSISGGHKIRYNAAGRVDQVISSIPNAPNQVKQYFYNNGQLTKIETNIYNPDGTLSWKLVKNFEWDAQGFVHKTWVNGSDYYTLYTRDACGNDIQSQDFIISDNRENRLSVATYSDTYNPEYLIGLHEIDPDYYSIHNESISEIIHWDNADFLPGPIEYQYEYNSDGLPVKRMSVGHLVAYFYE